MPYPCRRIQDGSIHHHHHHPPLSSPIPSRLHTYSGLAINPPSPSPKHANWPALWESAYSMHRRDRSWLHLPALSAKAISVELIASPFNSSPRIGSGKKQPQIPTRTPFLAETIPQPSEGEREGRLTCPPHRPPLPSRREEA